MSTMSATAIKPAANVRLPALPDNAPFTAAQRAWLNGFFAGLLGDAGEGAAATPAGAAPSGAASGAQAAPVEAEAEELPWHDPALPLPERLKLAEGKPRGLVLMAAMAQLDCGACGYACKSYADAIDRGEEPDLNRCAPGGADTAKKLKEVMATMKAPAAPAPPSSTPATAPAALGVAAKGKPAPVAPGGAGTGKAHGRDHPFPARLRSCVRLNGPGSEKDTRHVVLDLKGSGLTYKPGDALGVYPENCPSLVQRILEVLDASGAEDVPAPDGSHVSLRDALRRHYSITRPTRRLAELLGLVRKETSSYEGMTAAAAAALAAAEAAIPDPFADGRQVLDLLTEWRAVRPRPDTFVEALSPLQPRLYSISSSPLAHPGEVHLTVGVVRYHGPGGLPCKGVCSTYLAERVRPGQKVRVFVHPSSRFGLPADDTAPVIMVGPGTGVAPFRAFLHHRKAAGATGKNWLFFGDQRAASDFLYRTELDQHLSEGTLTRLETAFSRDGSGASAAGKTYVQHRMLEHAAEIWKWLREGAHFYVCGDARRMARDVDETLRLIVWEQGGMTQPDVEAYMADLTKTGRYQRDVY
jgi:sulfite reductase (NADPH) flavoprotein alpha-component